MPLGQMLTHKLVDGATIPDRRWRFFCYMLALRNCRSTAQLDEVIAQIAPWRMAYAELTIEGLDEMIEREAERVLDLEAARQQRL